MSTTIAKKVPYKTKQQTVAKRRKNHEYGSFLAKLSENDNSVDADNRSETTDNSNMATVGVQRKSTSAYGRIRTSPRSRRPYVIPEYDSKLDGHQQTYLLSPVMMETLQKTIRQNKGKIFTLPEHKIGFHGPRKPLLLSYPTGPKKVGKAIFLHRVAQKPSVEKYETPFITVENFPDSKEGRKFVRMAYHMRTGDSRTELPSPRRLKRPKTVAPSASRAELLSREKGFILDGIALSNIQDDYAKVQPKLGPAIPPYNAHFDRSVSAYFNFEGVNKNLRKTGQTKRASTSLQGSYVDRFHFIGDGHIYMHKRNKSGAGYSSELVNGHAQFMSEIRPMNGYNGNYGFRRNTPLLRNCPTPFGTASRSPTH